MDSGMWQMRLGTNGHDTMAGFHPNSPDEVQVKADQTHSHLIKPKKIISFVKPVLRKPVHSRNSAFCVVSHSSAPFGLQSDLLFIPKLQK